MYKARLPKLNVIKYGKNKNTTVHRLGFNRSSNRLQLDANVEAVVAHMHRYAMLHLQMHVTPPTSATFLDLQRRTASAPDEILWQKLHKGLALLEQGARESAFAALDAACQLVKEVLRSQPRLLFRGVFMVFGTSRWQSFPQVWRHLLKFFAAMALMVLGRHHPAFHVFVALHKGDTLSSSSELSLRCLLSTMQNAVGPIHPEILRTKRNLSIVLRRQEDVDESEDIMRETIATCEAQLGLVHVETLRCLRRLASLYMHHGKSINAEDLLVEVLVRAGRPDHVSGPLRTNDTDTFVYAERDLAIIAMQQGDMEKCRRRLEKFATVCQERLPITYDRPLPQVPGHLTMVDAEQFIKDMVMAYDLHCDELASRFMSSLTRRTATGPSGPSNSRSSTAPPAPPSSRAEA
jgi:Tetratricopeptide repeat